MLQAERALDDDLGGAELQPRLVIHTYEAQLPVLDRDVPVASSDNAPSLAHCAVVPFDVGSLGRTAQGPTRRGMHDFIIDHPPGPEGPLRERRRRGASPAWRIVGGTLGLLWWDQRRTVAPNDAARRAVRHAAYTSAVAVACLAGGLLASVG